MDTATTSQIAATLRDQGFVGHIVEPGDHDYDEARAGWNGAIDRRPAAVAHATDADDVAAAIRAAAALGIGFTIRAGGHSVSGRSIRDGALCIDIRALNERRGRPTRDIVRVGGGALLGELDAATQEHGLAIPAGQISHTGVGGLTLGGGMGWLMRHHGLTIDSLLAADVVLADGRRVRASEDEHADLLWALRGGGGDFAAVTAFWFRGRRVGPMILGGMLIHPCRAGGRGAARHARADGGRARRADDLRRADHRAAAGAVPGRAAGPPGARRRASRGAATSARASACSRHCARAARRRWTSSARCPTSRCRRCSTRRRRTAGASTTACTTCPRSATRSSTNCSPGSQMRRPRSRTS